MSALPDPLLTYGTTTTAYSRYAIATCRPSARTSPEQDRKVETGVPVQIDYYSDILSIWAWIAQRRQDELVRHFGDGVELKYRYVNVFGNTAVQIGAKWAERGGFEGFGRHVIDAAAAYEHAPVVTDIWQEVRPLSSTPAHTVLKAVEMCHSSAVAETFARRLRECFFAGPADVGRADLLLDRPREEASWC